MRTKYREKENKIKILTKTLTSSITSYAIDLFFEQICHICLSAINGLADYY